MKILSIGNSFSTDAHRFLHSLAKLNGYDIQTANLFIGGCSLETHWLNVKENNAYYDYEINGNEAERKISIAEALEADKWDVVTLQQASTYSGMFETYEPYLTELAQTVKKAQPQAKLYFHRTWSYETGSQHPGFPNYGCDSDKMYDCIKKASTEAAEAIGAEIIPAGTVIQHLRENTKEFDLKNGGLSLCRDTFHLSEDYGRYAAAATWLHTLTGQKLTAKEFEDMDFSLLKTITDTVNMF